jgi:hypothetical protein
MPTPIIEVEVITVGVTWDDTGRPPANDPRDRGFVDTMSEGLRGSLPDGVDTGPGRYLGPRYGVAQQLDPKDYPGAEAVDNVLRGEQPVITRQYTVNPPDADTSIPQHQLYGPPNPREITRDGTGGAQLVRRVLGIGRKPKPSQPSNEVAWETNAPRRDELQIRHDGCGGSQMIAHGAPADHSIAGLIGPTHFLDGHAGPPPAPLCQCGCGQVLDSRGSGNQVRKYYSDSCRQRAYQKRKQNILNDHSADDSL